MVVVRAERPTDSVSLLTLYVTTLYLTVIDLFCYVKPLSVE